MKRRMLSLLGTIALLAWAATALPVAQARRARSSRAPGYAVIRQYHVKPGASQEVIQRVRTGFVPIISGTPGFVAWYLLDAGNDTLVSVSVFTDKAGAEESTRRAAQWVKQNVAQLLPSPPEVTAGAVVVQKTR